MILEDSWENLDVKARNEKNKKIKTQGFNAQSATLARVGLFLYNGSCLSTQCKLGGLVISQMKQMKTFIK